MLAWYPLEAFSFLMGDRGSGCREEGRKGGAGVRRWRRNSNQNILYEKRIYFLLSFFGGSFVLFFTSIFINLGTSFFPFFFSLFLIFSNLGISYLHFNCYSLFRFPCQHLPNPFPAPSIWVFCSPASPITTLPSTITFTGGSVLAGPRASPSTGAPTRLFIAAYAVGAQAQSMYSL